MPDKGTATFVDESALGALCACLGRIPVGQQPIPNSKIPIDWDAFSDVKWEQLIHKAHAEGLAPLLYWILSRSGKFSSIPESARNSLRLMYSGTWMNNQIIFKELENLAQAFIQAEIPLVVLKGVCFALTIYPDIGLRPMGDLDLLVPGSKLSQAAQIAKSFGYVEQLGANPGLWDLHNHEIWLQKTTPKVITVELHKSLVAAKSFKYAIPMEWFWDQTEPMGGSSSILVFENLRMLTPTAQMLYAASHAMLQHGGKEAPLRWFYDLDRLIRFYAGRLDWDLLLSQSKIFEWGSALEAALSKTITCFDTPIPEHVLTSLSGISDRYQKLVALKQIRPATSVLDERHRLLSLKGSARFRFLLALIVPSPVYMRFRYRLKTSWAIPAYYVIRWWDILKDGFHSLVLLFKKRFQ